MLDEGMVKYTIESLEKIKLEAESILKWYNDEVEKVDGYRHLAFDYITDEDGESIMVFTGEDYFQGSTDYYSFHLPIELLYNPMAKFKLVEEINRKKEERLRKEKVEEMKRKSAEKAKERRDYERLKKKFEQ